VLRTGGVCSVSRKHETESDDANVSWKEKPGETWRLAGVLAKDGSRECVKKRLPVSSIQAPEAYLSTPSP
jgi:hypothetical protein